METKLTIEVTCPDCGGPISEIKLDPSLREYRCLIGHAYSARSILDAHSELQERALWGAVVALEEAAILARTVALQFTSAVQARLEAQAEEKMRLAGEIRAVLDGLKTFQLE